MLLGNSSFLGGQSKLKFYVYSKKKISLMDTEFEFSVIQVNDWKETLTQFVLTLAGQQPLTDPG